MKIRNPKFAKTLKRHKQMISVLSTIDPEEDSKAFGGVKKIVDETALELCLVYSNFKCGKCETEEFLTQHHLIMKLCKEYIDFQRYISLRGYWNNSIILCKKCHKVLHGTYRGPSKDDNNSLSKKFIEEVKKKYNDK